jgi:hypothetical protein
MLMTVIGKAREIQGQLVAAGKSVASAMKVAVISCILSVCALVVAIVALARPRHA